MSPKQTTTSQSFPQSQTYSPWTDAYQTNPMHLNGTYSNQNGSKVTPREDESQSPTHEALSRIYDLEERV
ncbi:MAG: hypothetical protein BroJett018_18090 [Chloroflexota bacterium]|nr:hypothetical protein [Chloroflexota bacterium]NOG63905.1 hypothetical protein [Chloroflexota bacterium]GIK64015.1 MAG: hypothetical protein BroJett018_18090 [Chloroflexota bacterium]